MAERAVRLGLGGLLWLASSCLLGCQTQFFGDAQFPGGALGCFKQCQKIGMEMASFVYVGEYSSACACKLKARSAAQSSSDEANAESAVVAAGAGVEMQRRRADYGQTGDVTPHQGPASVTLHQGPASVTTKVQALPTPP